MSRSQIATALTASGLILVTGGLFLALGPWALVACGVALCVGGLFGVDVSRPG